MKKYIILLLIVAIAGCTSTDSYETKKAKLVELKKEANQLQSKIKILETEINNTENNNEVKKYKTAVVIKNIKGEIFNHYFEVSGSVEAVHSAYISPEINGQIKKIYVKEGERVKKGQKLVKLNTAIIESSMQEIKTGLGLANVIYEKQKQLWNKNIGSEIEYLQAKNNKESLENRLKTLESQFEMAIIRSPINGIVDEIFQKEGELGLPGMQLMQVINLNKLKVNADVSESHLATVKKGDIVELSFPSYPQLNMIVPINRIGNNIKMGNRTFSIELKINNKNEMLKPNNMALIKINDFTSDDAFVVPSIIIKQDMKGSYLYIAQKKTDENWMATKKYVIPGKSYLDRTMIESGLSENDKVIVNGYNQVSNGSLISFK